MKGFKNFCIIFILLLSTEVRSQDQDPILFSADIPDQGESIYDFIPPGWSIRDSSSGLLDDDELTDFAMVIQLEDSMILKQYAGEDVSFENGKPRILLLLSQTSNNQYRKACQADQAILSENEGGSTGDPLQKLEIKNHELSFSFLGTSSTQWRLVYHFQYKDGSYFLTQAVSKGKGHGETYAYEYNLQSGELNIEIQDEKDPAENLKYSKIKTANGQVRLDNFLPLSYVIDEHEGIIF